MNPDPSLLSDPVIVLLAWAGGIALAASVVSMRSVVGPGFTWLAAATALLVGIWPAMAGGGPLAWTALAAVALGGLLATVNRPAAGVVLAVAGVSFVVVASSAGAVLAVTATLALGGITGEMLLGHWYLVDPTLPRWLLRALAVVGLVGIALDGAALGLTVGLAHTGFLVAVFWVLVVFTGALMAAVIGALRYPAYSGVMAATGLSYLAVLTGLAAVFFGRVLASGAGPMIS
ncbi:hypothetical protein BH23ACT5_BH23ACT5_02180 [soil metagenome]